MEEFKAGITYKLLDGKASRFFFTHEIRELFNMASHEENSFTFTPDRIDAHGDAYVGTVCVACHVERSFFEVVEKTQPVQQPNYKKPFKVGATYKLKKKYVNDFYRTNEIAEKYGNDTFSFTVSKLSGLSAYAGNITNGVLAASCERHMFKRVDNK